MPAPPEGLEFVDEARLQLGPRVDELVDRAHRAGRLRAGIESSDLVMVVLMLSAVADYHHDRDDPPWHRFFDLLVDGLRADAGDPLPGTALTAAEADDLVRGEHQSRRRQRKSSSSSVNPRSMRGRCHIKRLLGYGVGCRH